MNRWIPIVLVCIVSVATVAVLAPWLLGVASAGTEGNNKVLFLCINKADRTVRIVQRSAPCEDGEFRRLAPFGRKLNADTLDGFDSTAFALADHTHCGTDITGAYSGTVFNETAQVSAALGLAVE